MDRLDMGHLPAALVAASLRRAIVVDQAAAENPKSAGPNEFAGNGCPNGGKGGLAPLYVRSRFG
jgi:hypothetical protein